MVLAAALAASMTGCGGDAGETSQPTVLDSLPPEEGDSAADTGQEDGASADDSAEDPGGESDGPDPTPIPASSEGPAENWPAPEPPEEIYEPTEEGAEALIQHWFDARHYARITGDTEPWSEVTHENCAICDGHFDRVDAAYPEAWFVEEEPDQIIDAYVQLDSAEAASGLFAHRSVPFQAYREGELDSEYEGGEDSGFGFALLYEDGCWQLADLSYLGEYDENAREYQEQEDD